MFGIVRRSGQSEMALPIDRRAISYTSANIDWPRPGSRFRSAHSAMFAQSVDEYVDKSQNALLPTRLIVRVAHSDERAQQVLSADVAADFAGGCRAGH